jgi:hypothetical protein
MNRLLFASLILGTATALWLNRQTSLRQQRTELLALAAELEAHRQAAEEESARTPALDAAVERAKAERDRTREEVRSQASEPPPAELPGAGTEGRFPVAKPYFYVAKKHLANFQLELFEQEQLTAEAAVVFGLGDGERIAVNEAFGLLWARIAAVEAANVERLDPPRPVPVPGDTNRVIIARLPELRTELAPLATQFEETVRGILGAQRAELFLGHARAFFESELHGLGAVARSFAVSRWPGGSETLQVHYERGDSVWLAANNWSLPAAYGQRQFRHLFPDRVPFDPQP